MKNQGNFCVILALITLVWSGLVPHDRFTWFLEILPVLIILPFAVRIHLRYHITPLLMLLMTLHAIVLSVGGKYTYAEVPLGFWVRDIFDLQRNHYDRLGHFMQGFVPALLAREILLRKDVLKKQGPWLALIVSSLCLAFSACYEFIEWGTALISGESADAFLGTQGDVWDTQWDMFLALVGSVVSQLCLTHLHNRQLAKLRLN